MPLPPVEGFLAERYKVNFTTDLSDTLAEVKHLDSLGFSVPEVARNMSLQEERLTGVAQDLRIMLTRYHATLDEISRAEEELLLENIKETQVVLGPGPSQINLEFIRELTNFVLACNQAISYIKAKSRQIEVLRQQLQARVDIIANTDLFKFYDKESGINNPEMPAKQKRKHKLPEFKKFFKKVDDKLKKIFTELSSSISSMTPRLVKIEELLVATRTCRAKRLSTYYQHWEKKIYDAAVIMVSKNLDIYAEFLNSEKPFFIIQAILQDTTVAVDPAPPTILDILLRVIQRILNGNKKVQ